MDEHAAAELVVDVLAMTLGRMIPDAGGLVHHSNRASQYTSAAFTAASDIAGLRLSFGRTGFAYDCEMLLESPGRRLTFAYDWLDALALICRHRRATSCNARLAGWAVTE